MCIRDRITKIEGTNQSTRNALSEVENLIINTYFASEMTEKNPEMIADAVMALISVVFK